MEDAKKLAKEMAVFCIKYTHMVQTGLQTPLGRAIYTTTFVLLFTMSGDSIIERCTGSGENCWEMS